MSDWDNLADGVVSTRFGQPNKITVLFDDRMVSFPMSPAATLADLARRLTEEGGPHRQLLAVTIKLGSALGLRSRSR
jgi:hypothetical protein